MDSRLEYLLNWAKTDLDDNLMKWWVEHTVDEVNGGFYGVVGADNVPDETADKFIVLNARLVWTFSACWKVSKKPEYKELAERAYKYFTTYFYDKKNGGFYASVDSKGNPIERYKFTYGNVFAIYGLSEYADAFGCDEAKALALETVGKLDAHVWDIELKGYYEAASEDWGSAHVLTRIQRDERNQKTMNTHLHAIEAYANLLRIHESKELRARVRELLYIFLNKIINRENWHFNYFQTRDWIPTTPDLSFGHDIEGSWLLYECAEILDEKEALADTLSASVNMARAVYDRGVNDSGGIYTEYHAREKLFSTRFSWWEQNEGVVGFLNAYQLSGEDKFLDASVKALEFIDKYFIDREFGGWHMAIDQEYKLIANTAKCTGYNCPYHNARMSIEIIRRLEGFVSPTPKGQ